MAAEMRDEDVANAVLLLGEAWNECGPGLEALFRFLGDSAVSVELRGSSLVTCDNCGTPLYRKRGSSVVVLSDKERVAARGASTVPPIVLTVAQRWIWILCSRECAVRRLAVFDGCALRGGYPL